MEDPNAEDPSADQIAEAVTETERFQEALAKSSHFQQNHQKALLNGNFLFILFEIKGPPSFRSTELNTVIKFMRQFANTPELIESRTRMEKALKAIGVVS